MISLKTNGGSRTDVDLICVIDVSWSMNGDKIQLVKNTMKYLLEMLTPSDRLSIITFNTKGERICGLKCVTQENMVSFEKYILNLEASGGTSICEGLNLALQTIRERKAANDVTSIFLLSDG
jgi:Mg-chelatase subunit ChlD